MTKQRKQVLLAISCIVSGGLISWISGIALFRSYLFNSIAYLLGFVLIALGIGYLLVKLIFRFFY